MLLFLLSIGLNSNSAEAQSLPKPRDLKPAEALQRGCVVSANALVSIIIISSSSSSHNNLINVSNDSRDTYYRGLWHETECHPTMANPRADSFAWWGAQLGGECRV